MKTLILGSSDVSYLTAERTQRGKRTYNAEIRNILSLAQQFGWCVAVAGQHWS